MFRFVYDYALAPTIDRASDVISSTVKPVLTTAYNAGATVISWVQPLPDPGATTKWKHGKYKLLIEGEPETQFAFFKNDSLREELKDPHILAALHNPGLGLDLIVVHNLETELTPWIKRNYLDFFGTQRDRLYGSLCKMLEEDPEYYETLIRKSLEDEKSLLYAALHFQRYESLSSYNSNQSWKKITTTESEVRKLLDELEINRKLAKVESRSLKT